MTKSGFRTGRIRDKKSEPDIGKWEGIIERNLTSVGKVGRSRIFASAAGLCERQTAGYTFFDKDEAGENRKASTQFYFKLGNAFEQVVQRAFRKAGVHIDDETRIEAYHEDLPISGRIDFVISDPEDGKLTLVELKSCGKLPTQPKKPHLAQLMTYLVLTGQPRGLVWYISRTVAGWDGVLKQRVFEVEPTEEERYDTALRLALGAVYAREGYLPDKPEHIKKYACGFCSLIPHCWSGMNVGIIYKTPSLEKKHELLREATFIAEDVILNQEELRQGFDDVMLGSE